MRVIFTLWIACIVLCTSPVWAKDARQLDMASFQTVWETIRDKHWDLKSTGVDWDQIYTKYLPKAKMATSRAEMREVIQAMIQELGQSHFNILGEASSAALSELEHSTPAGQARPGFTVDLIEDKVYISSLDGNGPGTKAGLRIGDEILSVRQLAMQELVEKIKAAYQESAHAPLYIKRMLNQFFQGDSGEKVSLKIARKGQEEEKVTLLLTKPSGQYITLLNLPPTYYQYDSEILQGNIGYVRFNIWVPQVKQAFESKSLPAMSGTKGMIIDLRGNGGGLGVLAISLANKLVSENGLKLGTMRNGGTEMNFPIFPQPPGYTGPLAILIDEGSASTSEIFAAGMQEIGRARIFGVRSAGATLPSLIEPLPNGDLFQYAMADYISTSGKKLEGAGVIPDEATPHTLASLARGEDAALHAAQNWIQQQTLKGDLNE